MNSYWWTKFKNTIPFTKYELAFLGFWYIVLSIIWQRMFVFDGESYWAGWGFLWADWSAHITYVLNMAHRSLILPYHPLYFGTPFRYHFAADMISALLVRYGIPLVQALIVPSIVCSFMLVSAVYIFFKKIFKDATSAMISTTLLLCNGGLGFVWYIYYVITNNPAVQKGASIFRFTQIEDVRIEFTNLLTGYFIPQRSFLLGFPISICILLYFIVLTITPTITYQKKVFFLLGILTGIMPIIHIYAYIVIICVIVFLLLWNSFLHKKGLYTWIYFFGPALILGLGLYMHFWGFEGAAHIQYKPFWPTNGNILQWIYFCSINGGFVFILAPLSWYYAPRNIQIVSIPFALIFLVSNLFIFQPYSWDNGKFIAYACLWTSGLVGNYLYGMYNRYKNSIRVQIVILLIFYISIFSGGMDIANLTQFEHHKTRFFSNEHVQFGEKIRNIVPPNEIVLTGPFNSYPAMLSGRQLFMGYSFWVDSYGINSEDRIKAVKAMYFGAESAMSLFHTYNIHYVVISPIERKNLYVNEDFFSKNFTLLLHENDTSLYKLN